MLNSMSFRHVGATKLTKQDYVYMASLPYWTADDALMLASGYNPIPSALATPIEQEEIEAGELIRSTFNLLNDLILLEKGPQTLPPDEAPFDDLYHPLVFSKWAREHLPLFPGQLYDEVLKRWDKTQNPLKEKSPKSQKAAEVRWEKKYLVEKKIDEKIEAILKECHSCGHTSVANSVEEAIYEHGTLIKDAKLDENKITRLVIKRCLTMFHDKKLEHRIVGKSGYKKSDEYCPFHNS